MCAERAAIFASALNTAEAPRITALAIVGGPLQQSVVAPAEITPCGACLQVLAEFASADCRIICAGPDSVHTARSYTLSELLPHAFGGG
jgi:cytidine deaminase